MPPVDAAAQTIMTSWGAPGAVIVGLGVTIAALSAGMVALYKSMMAKIDKVLADHRVEQAEAREREKAERADMRAAHQNERTELHRANQQNFEQSLAASRENTATGRAVEQVLRDLTGKIGGITELARQRQNGA